MRNLGFGARICLDSAARKNDMHKPVGLYPCHKQGGNQVRVITNFSKNKLFLIAGVFFAVLAVQ